MHTVRCFHVLRISCAQLLQCCCLASVRTMPSLPPPPTHTHTCTPSVDTHPLCSSQLGKSHFATAQHSAPPPPRPEKRAWQVHQVVLPQHCLLCAAVLQVLHSSMEVLRNTRTWSQPSCRCGSLILFLGGSSPPTGWPHTTQSSLSGLITSIAIPPFGCPPNYVYKCV
mgnify:CR=1 FL=1